MKKIIARVLSAVLAVTTAAVLCLSAHANEYMYKFDDSTLVDGIEADTYDINGSEIVMERVLGAGESDPGMSVRCILFNEYIDPEFWNDPDVTVSIDFRLETEGVDVIGYIIGFDSKWTWINPSDFTVLKYNEWMTITETGAHFYEYFKSDTPNRLLFQARSNWGAGDQGSVKISARNFRISDGRTDVAVPTEEVSAPESTKPAESGEVSAPAPDNSTPASDTSAPKPATSVTSIQTASAASTSINYAEMMTPPDTEKSTVMVFVVIIIITVVVVAGIVVGYLIYKKKKYY